MTSIVRSTLVMALGLTLVLLGMTGAASAQDTYAPSAPQITGPGPISNVSGQLSGSQAGLTGDGSFNLSDEARAFISPHITTLNAVPAGSGGGVGGTGGGQLAFTGSETSVLAAGGMSLVLAGGVALIVSRRRD